MTFALALLLQEAAKEAAVEKPGMDLWKWLNFAILAGVLGWLTAKHLGPVLVNRTKQIHEGLRAGQRAKSEADARAAAVQAQIANLGQAVSEMQASARTEREREAERIRRETQAELARIEQNAEREIESAGKLARIELHRFAAKLAIDLAEQKVRARMSSEAQSALVNNFIGEMAGESAKAQLS